MDNVFAFLVEALEKGLVVAIEQQPYLGLPYWADRWVKDKGPILVQVGWDVYRVSPNGEVRIRSANAHPDRARRILSPVVFVRQDGARCEVRP